MRPEIDREKFAFAIAGALEREGISANEVARLPGLNATMISRARNGRVLTAACMLMPCRAFSLDPLAYLTLTDSKRNQPVTAIVPRETPGRTL